MVADGRQNRHCNQRPAPANAVRQVPHRHHEHRCAEDEQTESPALSDPGRITFLVDEFRHEEEQPAQHAAGDRQNQKQCQNLPCNRDEGIEAKR